uniref:Vasoactive intestinal peptide receptor 2 n=1 Tax=Iconisemion striatum TaxID=60296 RepID=A0A1A7XDE9_9TELE
MILHRRTGSGGWRFGRKTHSLLHLVLILQLTVWDTTESMHPDCALVVQHMKAQEQCSQVLQQEENNQSSKTACPTHWDNIGCWYRAEVGQVVTVSCANVSQLFANTQGFVQMNCTEEGWSDVFPPYDRACGFADDDESETTYFSIFKQVYTAGYATSLISLISAIFVFTVFRKFHCTRNYIHLNLFISFILRAVAVLVKDDILFSRSSQCSNQPSLVGCKASLVFFQYFIMANFFWLLVEGLYLHTLLVVIFSENQHFIIYMFIGWGIPTVFVSVWVITRIYLEDTGCWERNDNPIPNWVINGPIGFSIMVNFIQFVNIIRILVQKLRCPDIGGNDQSQYRRLAKSTLLLIPLFGIHYVVFVCLSESIAEDYKIFFDLALGSFQGLVVAILYCFLNSEVQGELKRKWRSMCLNCRLSRVQHFSSNFASRNGSEHMMQFHRNSRAQSILQSETTML